MVCDFRVGWLGGWGGGPLSHVCHGTLEARGHVDKDEKRKVIEISGIGPDNSGGEGGVAMSHAPRFS